MSVQSTSPARSRMLRTTGAVGGAAGVLFAGMVVWEHAGDLQPGTGPVSAVVGGGFAVAMAGYVVLAVGLAVAAPGGRRSRIFPVLLAVAWAALLAGSPVETFASVDPDTDPLNPIGGLLQGIALIGLGITVAVAGRWSGWRRFWPLGVAAFYTGALFVPAVLGVEPSAVFEAMWALGYAGLGLALVVEAGWSARRSAARAGAVTALLAGVVVLTAPTTGTTAQASSGTHHHSSGATLLERHRYASADSLEHYALIGR